MHKALCLLGVARHAGDEARQALLDEPPLQEVRTMISPYELRGIEIGRVEEKRDAIRRIARTLLGRVPESLEARSQETDSPEELDRLQEETLRNYMQSRSTSEGHE